MSNILMPPGADVDQLQAVDPAKSEPRKPGPTIHVEIVEGEQRVQLHFDPLEFKTWPWVKATLQMAIDQAEQLHRKQQAIAGMKQLQEEAADARLGQFVSESLKNGQGRQRR